MAYHTNDTKQKVQLLLGKAVVLDETILELLVKHVQKYEREKQELGNTYQQHIQQVDNEDKKQMFRELYAIELKFLDARIKREVDVYHKSLTHLKSAHESEHTRIKHDFNESVWKIKHQMSELQMNQRRQVILQHTDRSLQLAMKDLFSQRDSCCVEQNSLQTQIFDMKSREQHLEPVDASVSSEDNELLKSKLRTQHEALRQKITSLDQQIDRYSRKDLLVDTIEHMCEQMGVSMDCKLTSVLKDNIHIFIADTVVQLATLAHQREPGLNKGCITNNSGYMPQVTEKVTHWVGQQRLRHAVMDKPPFHGNLENQNNAILSQVLQDSGPAPMLLSSSVAGSVNPEPQPSKPTIDRTVLQHWLASHRHCHSEYIDQLIHVLDTC